MTTAERRINRRIPAKYEISNIHSGDYLISFCKDISIDGMFIQTDKLLTVGDLTDLTFSIGELKQMSVNAKVVWINNSVNISDFGMGVQFVKPPKVLKETILKIINRVAVIEDMKISGNS